MTASAGRNAMPLFPVTTVGSWPRPDYLLRALRQRQQSRICEEEFRRAADKAARECLASQERAGIDIVTDGEQRRDNFYSFVTDKLDGVRLMSLAEMLEVIEDKTAFEQVLEALDVPAYSIKNPTCTGEIRRRRPLALDEYEFLHDNTDRPIKITLPGPYLLTRSMWVKEVTRSAYESKEALGDDVVSILRQELEELRNAGAAFIQLDEPVLTELVFTQGQTITFMCAALAARKDPAEELEFAVDLVNRVTDGADGVRLGLHVCRGNWSRQEDVLLAGSYQPLVPYLQRMKVRQLVLEYATPRAGSLQAVGEGLNDRELGLGVVNPRNDEAEDIPGIVDRAEEALRFFPPDAIFLNPDCGFGTFANRPLNTAEVAERKLRAMVSAAEQLRARHQPLGAANTSRKEHGQP
jgi:5-methyltetrahydropteroyltriglutamate--homocysteine methyltransferase